MGVLTLSAAYTNKIQNIFPEEDSSDVTDHITTDVWFLILDNLS